MDYLIIEEKSQVKEVYKIFVRTFITLDRTLKNVYLCMYNNYKNNANYVSKQGNILSSIYIVNLTRFLHKVKLKFCVVITVLGLFVLAAHCEFCDHQRLSN